MTSRFALYPAIDLKDGRCVRLLRGNMNAATIYNDDPTDQARRFADAGFAHIHIVDLDGAFAGESRNGAAVEAILRATPLAAQIGGGVRTLGDIHAWLDRGAERVIVGTAAITDPDFLQEACASFPGRVLVGVDARDGRAMIAGWAEDGGVDAQTLGRRAEAAGAAGVIHTDIARDGAKDGPNVAATAALAQAIAIPVIASGGVSCADDIAALAAAPGPIGGAVIGRALYDGSLTPENALRAAARPAPA